MKRLSLLIITSFLTALLLSISSAVAPINLQNKKAAPSNTPFCSTPKPLINQNYFQVAPIISQGRYIVAQESSKRTNKTDIFIYDLGKDKRHGTSDDKENVIKMPTNQYMPRIDGQFMFWISNKTEIWACILEAPKNTPGSCFSQKPIFIRDVVSKPSYNRQKNWRDQIMSFDTKAGLLSWSIYLPNLTTFSNDNYIEICSIFSRGKGGGCFPKDKTYKVQRKNPTNPARELKILDRRMIWIEGSSFKEFGFYNLAISTIPNSWVIFSPTIYSSKDQDDPSSIIFSEQRGGSSAIFKGTFKSPVSSTLSLTRLNLPRTLCTDEYNLALGKRYGFIALDGCIRNQNGYEIYVYRLSDGKFQKLPLSSPQPSILGLSESQGTLVHSQGNGKVYISQC